MTYSVKIHTGDERFAGTDSNIFVRLIGERGETGEYRLNRFIGGNAFERNDDDPLILPCDDVGDIYLLKLRSDHRYAGADWLCDSILIKSILPLRLESVFRISEWISDTQAKEFSVTSGYRQSMEVENSWVETNGPTHHLTNPTDQISSQEITVSHNWSASLSYEMVKVISASLQRELEVGVDIPIEVVKMNIKNSLKGSLSGEFSQTTNYQLDEEVKTTFSAKFDISPHTSRMLQEKWSLRHSNLNITLGDTNYQNILLMSECRFSGFVEPGTQKWVYKPQNS